MPSAFYLSDLMAGPTIALISRACLLEIDSRRFVLIRLVQIILCLPGSDLETHSETRSQIVPKRTLPIFSYRCLDEVSFVQQATVLNSHFLNCYSEAARPTFGTGSFTKFDDGRYIYVDVIVGMHSWRPYWDWRSE
jgi:hypothetical protein